MDSTSSALKSHLELPLNPRFAGLREPYHTPVMPTALPQPQLLHFNAALAAQLGLEPGAGEDRALLEILAGNRPWPGYAPLASVYAGHQFGAWVPQLGDGRALMIAEIHTPTGERAELQLKGSGQTPYSRGADGRAVLRSSIREYLCSEAMHGLGVPTTRCLSLIASPEPVQRERVETAAVVCRVAPSFVRFGHFEFFSHHSKTEQLVALADHVIVEQFPELQSEPQRHAIWLGEVVERTARLMAQWQTLGFCHGVMNTDNFSILGLTLDYGPFGFMDAFRHHHVCNHSDYEGRYAYDAQPAIGQWNCSRLLQACLPLLAPTSDEGLEIAGAIYERYAAIYAPTVMRRWVDKLGLRELHEGDAELVNRFLTLLHQGKCDFTQSFRQLSTLSGEGDKSDRADVAGVAGQEAFAPWLADYRARLGAEQNIDAIERAARMSRVNPKYVLRNHLAQAAVEKAEAGDFSEVDRLMRLLSQPYDEQPEMDAYAAEPPAQQRRIEVSCSS